MTHIDPDFKELLKKYIEEGHLESDEQKILTSTGTKRICPQLSCTIDPEEKAMLDELTLDVSNRFKKVITTSTMVGILIRYGYGHKNELLKELN